MLYSGYGWWYTFPHIMVNTRKARRILASAIVVASVTLVVYIAIKVSKDDRAQVPPPLLPSNVDVAMDQLQFSEVKDGVKKWDLTADKAEYEKAKELTKLTRPKMTLPAGGGHEAMVITADKADYFNATRDVKLFGNVVLTSEKGLRFTTDRAEYIAARSQITTNDRVRMSKGGLTVNGVGMDLSTITRDAKVRSNVTAVILPDKHR
jgi:LPS export ABC transporter protein LptC